MKSIRPTVSEEFGPTKTDRQTNKQRTYRYYNIDINNIVQLPVSYIHYAKLTIFLMYYHLNVNAILLSNKLCHLEIVSGLVRFPGLEISVIVNS